jgi:hypothetical protein
MHPVEGGDVEFVDRKAGIVLKNDLSANVCPTAQHGGVHPYPEQQLTD